MGSLIHRLRDEVWGRKVGTDREEHLQVAESSVREGKAKGRQHTLTRPSALWVKCVASVHSGQDYDGGQGSVAAKGYRGQ